MFFTKKIYDQLLMNSEELQSKTISWLRFPLAIAIVFHHSVDSTHLREVVSQINYAHLSGLDICNFFRWLISDILCRIATSCFCIFSGFLFFYKTKEWNKIIYFKKVKRKSKTLLLPYVLWNIIPVALMLFYAFIRFDGSLSTSMYELYEKGIYKIFWNFYDGFYPYNIPLWFLRDLIVVAFLSPLVYYFVKYAKIFSLLILGFFFYTNFWFPVVSIRALFFFTLGAYFSIHGKNMIMELRKGKWFWYLATFITLILSVYFKVNQLNDHFYLFFNLTGCITTMLIASHLLERGTVTVNPFLSKTSFFIFATHNVLLLWYSIKFLDIILISDTAFILILKYFLAPLICVGLCLGIYYAAQKTVPKVLAILTGSR